MGIREEMESAQSLLRSLLDDDTFFEAAEAVTQACVNCLGTGGKIMAAGNGGSLSDAGHFAEELTGRFRKSRRPLPAIAFTDASHMSCTANDYGFEFVFSRLAEAYGNSGDVLLLLTTSGGSANLIEAAKTAQEQSVTVIGLTGRGGGALKDLCSLHLHFPGNGSDRIQELQMLFLHALIAEIEVRLDLA